MSFHAVALMWLNESYSCVTAKRNKLHHKHKKQTIRDHFGSDATLTSDLQMSHLYRVNKLLDVSFLDAEFRN